MDEKKNTAYDAVVVFDTPIRIQNDRKETISIFGLLYKRDMRKRNDLFVWSVQRYITYLMGCQQVQEKGGKLSPEIWMLPNEHIITLGNPVKNFIYKFLKPQLPILQRRSCRICCGLVCPSISIYSWYR